eukprot:gnl/TRDRNA2_/TRDRNA2_183069_c0_seq1.p1 gnl/TRDRNA2_/TRDRNA2_183069_c0~~gnl/TRDRNA2_/TRDRNA2_183069_c0_seq1.p1  ORF type:complete len:417 (-),score=88.82 gnl/TRDRNA2_/TRDRNA2_183069_c0_seq1:130-1380(-)
MDDWNNGSSFSGDFYREPDDVTRGVTMAPPPLVLQTFQDGIHGDIYGKDSAIGHEGQYPFGGPLGLGGDDFNFTSMDGKDTAGNSTERFTECDRPPTVPTDSFFKFEPSTKFVSSDQPHEIGNQLLDFLNTEVAAVVTKVNRKKFAIKAYVFAEGIMTTVKMRVWSREEEGDYAVEIQRRGGDGVAFNMIYARASEFILMRIGSTSYGASVPAFEGPKKVTSGDGCSVFGEPGFLADTASADEPPMLSENVDLSPLIELAVLDSQPSLQAECAVALAKAAQDPKVAASLCKVDTFEKVAKLLHSDNIEVAYPTACLLNLVAQSSEAKSSFASSGILLVMLKKVQAKGTSALVRLQLAQAANLAISRCHEKFSLGASLELEHALTTAIEELGETADAKLYRELQDAMLVITAKCHAP